MAELKTFLFTDIVGSVELKREMPGHSDAERDQAFIEQVLTPHRERIERELAAHSGRVVSTAGDGHFLVFSDTVLAARWAVGIQKAHRDEPIRTPQGKKVAVRVSMHLGIPQTDPRDANNFVGKTVDYAARLNDYATGQQILVSRSVVSVLEDAGMDGVSFHHHGRREMAGIGSVDVYELVYDLGGPRKMRGEPRESARREWTVLPPTMLLADYRPGSAAGGAPVASLSSTKLGHYELEERLGTGGMGDVYRARHTQFGRIRAVKVIKQHFVDSGHREVVRRFYQEIKAVGALEHPNIVVAIDSSAPTDPVHYLVMEYIEGVGADQLVSQHGPLGVAEACEIARQAARGLAYIHEHGMVHRDIKPSNLMLTVVRSDQLGSGTSPQAKPDEQALVKILDLGLALLVGDDQQRLTLMDNRAMGTAMYMSPEQWLTTSVDIRADIYSLGCTLYHMLSGKPPFLDSDLRPEKAHQREKLPPIRGASSIPRPLWDILQRMTAKNPVDRFAEPAEVAAALAPWAEGHQLVRLVRESTGPAAADVTQGIGRTDTRRGRSAESDTRHARRPSSWNLPSLPAAPRHRLWRAVTIIALIVAVAAVGRLAYLRATWRHKAVAEAQLVRQRSLRLAAAYATSEILRQMRARFDQLSELAKEDWLQERLVEIDNAPDNEELWNPLQDWIGARKADFDQEAPADSWFIDNRYGLQVARSPRSDTSLGEDYSHRDYFHGRGEDLEPGTAGLEPIQEPHLSAVYRSTSTGRLRVAFSVPIENGRTGPARKVVGVLAMSVDLGEFNVLQKELPKEHEVVLIDLRESTIDGQSRRGLILHHYQARASDRRERAPPWVGSELLARFDALLATDGQSPDQDLILSEYRDEAVTDGELYWGAIQRVVDQRSDGPEGESLDYQWLVLVQEPVATGVSR
jgi:serine/threonine protein kinase/class 3 adenylate cyclase